MAASCLTLLPHTDSSSRIHLCSQKKKKNASSKIDHGEIETMHLSSSAVVPLDRNECLCRLLRSEGFNTLSRRWMQLFHKLSNDVRLSGRAVLLLFCFFFPMSPDNGTHRLFERQATKEKQKSAFAHVLAPKRTLMYVLWPPNHLRVSFGSQERDVISLPGGHVSTIKHPRGHFRMCFGSQGTSAGILIPKRALLCVWAHKRILEASFRAHKSN